MTLVVDASAIVVLPLRLPGADVVEREVIRDYLVAPTHLDAEVLSALVHLTHRGSVEPPRAQATIGALVRARIRRVVLSPLLHRAWAHRHNLSAYDGLYVALADRLGCGLLTADRRLAGALGLGVPVTFVAS